MTANENAFSSFQKYQKTMDQTSLPKSFDDLIARSDKPVLVDFWADWCGACKMLSPVMRKVASEYKNRLITIKINVDQKSHLASRYEISSIPTVMLFYKGSAVMRFSGALSYDQFRFQLDQTLSKL